MEVTTHNVIFIVIIFTTLKTLTGVTTSSKEEFLPNSGRILTIQHIETEFSSALHSPANPTETAL